MVFKVATRKTVWWPATMYAPLDGGIYEEQAFEVQLEIIPQSESEEIVYGKHPVHKDVLARYVVGLRQKKDKPEDLDQPLLDQDGQVLEFEAAKKLLLDLNYARVALFAAYSEASGAAGRRKNS